MCRSTTAWCAEGVGLFEAKNRLSELVHRVEAGEKIAITRRGKVVARLVPPAPEEAERPARDAIAGLRASRQGVSLGRLNSRDLIRQGRRARRYSARALTGALKRP